MCHMRSRAEIQGAMLLKKRLLVDPEMFRPEFLRSKHWAAVPVESASRFDSQDASRLSSAMRSLGAVSCLAVITDELANGPMTYKVAASEEGLMSFNRECFGLNALLVPDDEAFAILCTVDDHYVVTGPRHFVAATVGGDIPAARQAFFSFASDTTWPDNMRRFLLNVASAYSSFEG
jgi:hypothetical protein